MCLISYQLDRRESLHVEFHLELWAICLIKFISYFLILQLRLNTLLVLELIFSIVENLEILISATYESGEVVDWTFKAEA